MLQPGQPFVVAQGPDQYGAQIEAPQAMVGRGRVRVVTTTGQSDIRDVIVASAPGAWELWARELRFALESTRFVDIGGTVYRSETIDRADPIRDVSADPAIEALQATMGALAVIRDGHIEDYTLARQLAQQVLAGLEDLGFRLPEPAAEA